LALAAKKSQKEAIRVGLNKLRAAGVSLDDVSPEGISRLAAEFGKNKDTNLAVVYTLGRAPDPTAAQTLAAIERCVVDKDLKKEIRRAFFKLGQKGLVSPHVDAVETRGVSLFRQESSVEAYMSAVDGGGGRLLWIAKPQPNHGLQVIQAMLHDREGLLRIGAAQMPRKELRKMAADIKQQHGVTMIAVPWEFADHKLYEGYEKAKARGQSGLENFYEVRSIIATGKPTEQLHPIYNKIDRYDVRDGPWREASRRLLDEPELRYWILTDDWLQAFLPQLEEAQTSRLVLNPAQKEERSAAIVRDAVKNLCSGDNGKAFQRRMEDMALYFFETGRAAQAKLSLAIALQAAEGDPGPLDVSFLTGLVQKSFAFLLAQSKAKREEEPSLIIKP
jgi:hypothetical protein